MNCFYCAKDGLDALNAPGWISWDQNQCSQLGSYSLLQLQLLGIALHTLCTCQHFAKSDNLLRNNSLHPAAELLTALQCDHKSCIALRRAATHHLSSTGSWNATATSGNSIAHNVHLSAFCIEESGGTSPFIHRHLE